MRIVFAGTHKGERPLIGGLFRCAELVLGQHDLKVAVSFVSPRTIKQLNGSFRNTDRVTDVLSFPSFDITEGQVVDVEDSRFVSDVEEDGRLFIGDIVVCRNVAEAQAEEYGHSVEREICFLCLHGLLHLLGYDHVTADGEKRMIAKQKEILDKYGVVRGD